MMMSTSIWFELLNVVATMFTDPAAELKMTWAPDWKLNPLMVTVTTIPRDEVEMGNKLVISGAGFAVMMRNALTRLPLLPSGFVTVTVREEDVFWMSASTVMFATNWLELRNVTELTAMPSPKLATAPGWKRASLLIP